MTDNDDLIVGTIIDFGGSYNRGKGFGFIKQDNGGPDIFFTLTVLRKSGFPIPQNPLLLNGLRVKAHHKERPSGDLQAIRVELIGEPNYELRVDRFTAAKAAKEVTARPKGENPQPDAKSTIARRTHNGRPVLRLPKPDDAKPK